MTVEVVSETDGRVHRMNPKAFGKLLHIARLHGWVPEKLSSGWPSDTWETTMILPHIGPYMPGRVSRLDAEGLKRALMRARATGSVALDGTAVIASEMLLQAARAGAFQVRFTRSESLEPRLMETVVGG
jgi:hypothetical protein